LKYIIKSNEVPASPTNTSTLYIYYTSTPYICYTSTIHPHYTSTPYIYYTSTIHLQCTLPSIDEEDQLLKIFQLLGSPTEETWPGITRLPREADIAGFQPKHINNVVPTLNHSVCDVYITVVIPRPETDRNVWNLGSKSPQMIQFETASPVFSLISLDDDLLFNSFELQWV
jgi:hypothetical protein